MIKITETNCREIWPPRTKVIPHTVLRCESNGPLTFAATPRGQGTPTFVDAEYWLVCQTPYLGKLEFEWVENG